MKYLLMLLGLLVSGMQAQAQSLSPRVLASSGSSVVSGNTYLAFTVGETAIATQSLPTITLGQGFHQGVLFTTAVETPGLEAWVLRVFPNPTAQSLWVQFTPPEGFTGPLSAVIWDNSGKVVREKFQVNNDASIDVGGLPDGSYHLQLTAPGGENAAVRFIKINP
ncbi:MAG: T9SS type A sorting domain-containing protein [Saprospiraceae bacterium]|nr:T9SS type A sorting domain-containing protein [Saprospiraceae bacterium]